MIGNRWDPSLYDQSHSFVFERGLEVVSLLDPRPGERILDVGCGTGHLTHQISKAGARVVGLDHSPAMLAAARAHYPDLELIQGDASNFSFTGHFDAVFSNAVLHWVRDADRAAACIAAVLNAGARFVAEFGAKGNVDRIHTALEESVYEFSGVRVGHGRYFPSIPEYASLLEKQGLEVTSAILFDRITPLSEGEQGLRNWVRMFGENMLRGLSNEVRQSVTQRVEQKLRPVLFQDGCWYADYRRLRIVAYKR
ncbi:MAG TPA: methyltransferase domain-containing protein [Acidobacteriota bacterium]